MKVVIPGGSGQVGTILARHFHRQGHSVTVLSRNPRAGSVAGGSLGRRDGGPVDRCPGAERHLHQPDWTKRGLSLSRRESTPDVRLAHCFHHGCSTMSIASLKHPPRLWLNASTATIYRHALDRPMDEMTGELGGNEPGAPDTWNFSIKIAKDWEAAFFAGRTPLTRKIAMRSSMTFTADRGGVFDVLSKLVRAGLGGTQGSGTQRVSWIHEADFVRAIEFLIADDDVEQAR